jgi:uncharacterized protein (TIGR00730 family)
MVFDILVLSKNLFKVTFQIIRGVWKIKKLHQPIITIFGSARLKQGSPFFNQAHNFGHTLIEKNISLITGGGPGIMLAITCGAIPHSKDIKARTLSVTVRSIFEKEPENPCAQDSLVMDYFFARKWLMMQYSVAFVVFPGGFGTLDEFAEVMTLLQTKLLPGKPVILIDTDYWKPLIQWIEQKAIKHGTISQAERDLLYVTDDLEDAIRVIEKTCLECMGQQKHKKSTR